MGAKVTREDFDWVDTDEPHATRRREILEKYPQIKKLMGHDVRTAYYIVLLFMLQLTACWMIKDSSWPLLLLTAYVFGGTVNKLAIFAMHEGSHKLIFGHRYPKKNHYLGMFGNLILGLPAYFTFRKYHLDHHRYQGMDTIDGDIPTKIESKLFYNRFMKVIWLLIFPFTYSLRQVIRHPRPISMYEVYSVLVAIAFDVTLCYTMGFKALAYLLISTLLGGGIHPVNGHAIAEHFLFKKGQETYSYYGPFNYIALNVGYHNEHHDFPNIPWTKLPQVKKIAPEYYENLAQHTSWPKVLWDFIFDPDLSPAARIKRPRRNVDSDKRKDD